MDNERRLDLPEDDMSEEEFCAISHAEDFQNAATAGTTSGEIGLWVGDDLNCDCPDCVAIYTKNFEAALKISEGF